MDLKLKITQKEGTSMASLIKQMCALKCRIKVDVHEGDISIVGMDDNNVENVIDSIDEAFNIVGVDIVPTVEIPEHEELSEKYGDDDNDDSMRFNDTDEILGAVTYEGVSDEGVTEAPEEETTGDAGTASTTEGNSDESAGVLSNSDSSKEDMSEVTSFNDTKKTSAEDYVAELFANSLASLDKSQPIIEQIDKFLNGIGFITDEKIIKQSFVAACEVKKVGYESIILELRNAYPKIREEIIKATMREEFKKWLTRWPEVKEKYPKISFMVLLKVFSRKMR